MTIQTEFTKFKFIDFLSEGVHEVTYKDTNDNVYVVDVTLDPSKVPALTAESARQKKEAIKSAWGLEKRQLINTHISGIPVLHYSDQQWICIPCSLIQSINDIHNLKYTF